MSESRQPSELDTTGYPEQSLMDISISSISTRVVKIKDTLWNYFGIQKILEPRDPVYQQLLEYAQSIKDESAIYHKANRKKEENKIRASEDVQECYKVVPPKYFEQNFQLTLNRKKAHESKIILSEYLDQIDVTLFSMVNANFSKYMGPMLQIQEIDVSTEQILKKINKRRDELMKLENQFIYKAIKNQKLSYISKNLTTLVTNLKLIQKIKQLPNKINECIEKGKCDYQIFAQLQTYKNQTICQKINCLGETSKKLDQLKDELTVYLRGLVDSNLYKYINAMTLYTRNWSHWQVDLDQSFNPDITILNTTQVAIEDQDTEDPILKQQLVHLIKLCSKLEINIAGFSRKLSGRLQSFSESFQEDLGEYLMEMMGESNLAHCFEKMEIKHFVQIVVGYFKVIRNLFSKLVQIFNYGNRFLGSEEILSPFRVFIVDQIQMFLSYKKLRVDVDAEEFSSYLSLIDYWISAQDLIPELQLSSLRQTKKELLNLYLKNFHQSLINGELKSTIKKDTFESTYIPADYYVQFQNIFNPNTIDQSLMLETTFNSSRRKERKRGENTKSSSSVIMLNKELNINGQSYRVCGSFLLLLEIIQQYGDMAKSLVDCQELIEKKTMEVIYFYNEETRKMILGREIVQQGVAQVSLKHLCLLARVLCLIKLILSKLCFKNIEYKKRVQDSLMSHVNDIWKQVSTVAVCNIDSEVSSLYDTGRIQNVLGSSAPCKQSEQIIMVISKIKNTLAEYQTIQRIKILLKPGLKSISKLYFQALKNEGPRGKQQIDWMMMKLQIHLGAQFDQQLKGMSN